MAGDLATAQQAARQAIIAIEELQQDAVVELTNLDLEMNEGGWRTFSFTYRVGFDEKELWEN